MSTNNNCFQEEVSFLAQGLQIRLDFVLISQPKYNFIGAQNKRINEHPKHIFEIMGKKLLTVFRSKSFLIWPYVCVLCLFEKPKQNYFLTGLSIFNRIRLF